MGKDNLVGNSLWDKYSKKVKDRMDNPTHKGELTEEMAKAKNGKLIVAEFGAESCGDEVRIYWIVDKNNTIVDAKFKSFGCGTAIASSDMMAELCIGKNVDEALKITNIEIERALRDREDIEALPPQKMHCSVMAHDVIKKAASVYKGVDVETLEDKEIVCECARVTLATIKEAIRVNDLKTVEDITNYTKAGGYCKSCIRAGGHEAREIYLEDILNEALSTTLKGESMSETEFKNLTIVQKLKLVEEIIDKNIREFLVRDGGNLEIVDIKDGDEGTEIYIRYIGACSSCAHGAGATLNAIENTLIGETGEETLKVIPI